MKIRALNRRRPVSERLESRSLLSTIQGSVFEDLNASGSRDAGEPALTAAATVYLDVNHDGVFDAGDPSTTTAVDGSYAFSGLGAGTYTVGQLAPAGTRQTAPAPSPGPGLLGDINKDVAPPADHPYGLAWVGAGDANPGLYVVANDASAKEQGAIDRVDPATGATLGSIPSGSLSAYAFVGLAYDGQHLWGADINNSVLVEFDTAGNVLRSFASPLTNPRGLAWDGQALWVSAPNSAITKVDPASGQVLASIPAPDAQTAALAFDGTHLWASGLTAGKAWELDPNTGAVLRSFAEPAYPQPSGASLQGDVWGLTYDGQGLWLSLRGISGGASRLFQVDISHPGTQTVTLDGTDGVTGVDFGDFRLGSISGKVADGSGVGLAGWHVYVDNNGNGQPDPWEPSALSDSSGQYTLTGLKPGTYTLTELPRQPGWSQTAPANPSTYTSTITTSGQSVTGENFTDVLSGVGPIGPEVLVNTTTAGSQQITSIDAVSSDGNGRYVVVWQGPSAGGSGVFARMYAADGTALTGEILVDSVASGSQHNIVVAMNASDSFVVGWAYNFSVYARTFKSSGAANSGRVTVFTATSRVYGNSYGVGIDSAGNYGVEYWTGPASLTINNTTKPSFNVQLFTATGSSRLKKPILVSTDGCLNCGGGALAMAPDGHFVVAWHNNGVFANRYSSTGSLLGSTISVAPNDWQDEPSIAMDPATGNFVIAWEELTASAQGRAARLYSSTGSPLGTSLFLYTGVGAGANEAYPVAMNGNAILLAYPLNGNVEAQRFSADGKWTAIDTQPFIVNTTLGLTNDGNSTLQTSISTAFTGGSNFVVTWSGSGLGDGAGVFFQRYAAATGNAALQAAGAIPSGSMGIATALPSKGDFVVLSPSLVDAVLASDPNGLGIVGRKRRP